MGDGGNVEVELEVVVGAAHDHQRRRKSCRHQGFQVSCWTGALTIGCKPKKSKAVRGGRGAGLHALVKHNMRVLHMRLDTRTSISKTGKDQ
jgi:hypothetical protein